jgi:hypothetical protein
LQNINQNRILGEIEDKVQQIITLVFENYKSLDESLPSGMMDVLKPATGMVAPVLVSALKLYSLLHDILSPEAQLKLCRYFQVLETNLFFLMLPFNIFPFFFHKCYWLYRLLQKRGQDGT